jgi:RNA polymerase sigma factor (sigma-70 family)
MAFEPNNKYKGLDDKKLMALADEGEELAFCEFYERHYRELYRFCHAHYSTVLAYKSGIRDNAEDLTIETFAKAWQYAGSYDDNGLTEREALHKRSRNWLCGIARNAAADLLRKRKLPTVVHYATVEEWDAEHSHDGQAAIEGNIDPPSDEQTSLERKIEANREAFVDDSSTDDLDDLFDADTTARVPSNRLVQLVMEAIEQALLPAEQQLVYAMIERHGEPLPGWLKRQFAELLEVKEDSLKVKWSRAKKKIRTYVQAKLDSQDEGKDD